MKITILYFAMARDLADTTLETVELSSGATASTALRQIIQRHPGLAALEGSLRMAVNEEFASGQQVLQEGDSLALLPPVSGG